MQIACGPLFYDLKTKAREMMVTREGCNAKG